ncbi:leucine-rich repeat domain-containing protein [Paenibacillus sp. FSL R10-2736]|uniref:leucine-rich repeat domain-containing protein n=1 Tax=Paenibacillus sp. FSL R10-2736 TaxID=2954692 RepID=UPI0030FB6480
MIYLDFKDNGFKRAVMNALKVAENSLTQQDISKISGIVVSTSSEQALPIPWLLEGSSFGMRKPNLYFNVADSENCLWEEDLKLFKHISSLYLFVRVGDLGYLRHFTELRDFYVAKGSTTLDWSFLEETKQLTYLLLQEVSLKDLEMLRRLAESQDEEISTSKKTIFRRSGLTCLRLAYCNIEDVSPLASCRWLTELDLSNNNISDFSSLLGLQHLYSLTLRYNSLSDLSFITKDCPSISYLNLRHNNIKDISPLVYMVGVYKLYLGYNPIIDFKVLDQLKIRNHDVESYSGRRRT